MSGEFKLSLMCFFSRSYFFPNSLALLNFSISLSCLGKEVSDNQTYFSLPLNLSSHLAIHIKFWFHTICFHFSGGLGASGERFKIISSSVAPSFHFPLNGCLPLPMKIELGSAM